MCQQSAGERRRTVGGQREDVTSRAPCEPSKLFQIRADTNVFTKAPFCALYVVTVIPDSSSGSQAQDERLRKSGAGAIVRGHEPKVS